MKRLRDMTRAELERAKKRAGIACSQLCDELIAAGRGNELPSEIQKKSDPLSLRYMRAQD